MERKTKDEKNLAKMKKLDNKSKLQYETKKCMKKRIKNSKIITNVKEIRVGINNVELSQWRISVVKNNSMSLKKNDYTRSLNK